jgi:hypothetical protein
MTEIDEKTRTELEAAAFRKLVAHLRARTDVQNIDMMNLAGFCRNCLSNWYQEAVSEKGLALDKAEARAIIYGMPYEEWRERHQKEANQEQLKRFESTGGSHGH